MPGRHFRLHGWLGVWAALVLLPLGIVVSKEAPAGPGSDDRPAGQQAAALPASDAFQIVFSQDFEGANPGPYRREEWVEHWRHPEWSCPNGTNWAAKSRLEIRGERGSQFMRHGFEPGDFNTNGEVGMQWETPIGSHDELYLSYRARCSDLFTTEDLDGKTPGLLGRGPGPAIGPSKRPGPDSGFTARLMFHNRSSSGKMADKLAAISPYLYHQEMKANSRSKDGSPLYYGNTFGTPFDLEPNRWYTVTLRVVMNTPQQSNGIFEFFVDGRLAASEQGFRWRDTPAVTIRSITMANFLGGSGKPCTVPGYWDFDDVVAFTYREGADVPRGTVRSAPDRVLALPSLRR